MGESTTEARRHGEKQNHVCAIPRFDEPWYNLKQRVFLSLDDHHERNSLVQAFSVSLCLRGESAASGQESLRP